MAVLTRQTLLEKGKPGAQTEGGAGSQVSAAGPGAGALSPGGSAGGSAGGGPAGRALGAAAALPVSDALPRAGGGRGRNWGGAGRRGRPGRGGGGGGGLRPQDMTTGRRAEGADPGPGPDPDPDPDPDPASARLPSRVARLLSALFYGACSFLIVLVNKALLTAYGFPSPIFLGIGQMAATIMILYVSKLNKIIHFPDFDKKIPVKLFPLPLLYIGNHISGLSSTSKLSLPMFTVLRKFTIPLTLLLETIILGKQYSLNIIASVFTIILGAFIAAGSDLAFNLEGYIFVFLNDIFTAANGVYTKQKMDPKELGKYGVLFYNACFMIIPTLIISVSTGDLRQATEFNEWKNVLFIIQFLLSCFLGFLLMYSMVLCSYYNSALTTAVVGAIKNVSIAYIGMLVGGDYIFSVLNFVGLNIWAAGVPGVPGEECEILQVYFPTLLESFAKVVLEVNGTVGSDHWSRRWDWESLFI
uniref:Solute carrier family 35 member D2 n=1 Tax=Canis lupus familiaris TaxID=9615 RepID=A0A8P0P161_CANLF